MSSVDASIPVPVMLPRSPSPSKRAPTRRLLSSPGQSSVRPARPPSPPVTPSSSKQTALGRGIVNFHSYCQDLISFDDYPDVSAQDRAIISGFLTGDLLKNEKWREKFPSGKFECTLQASNESQSDEFGCKEKIVFKIDFQRVSCIKSITRRVWSSKTRPADTGSEIGSESPTKTPSMRSIHSRKRTPKQRRSSYPQESESPRQDTPKRSNSFPEEKASTRRQPRRNLDANGAGLIELESPIKEGRRPTRKTNAKESVKRSRSVSQATPGKSRKSSVKKQKKPKVSNQVWNVESILDHKAEGGKDLFLVKWEGKDDKRKPWENTWEPKANISRDLIDEFWQTHKGKKTKRSTGPKSKK